MLFNGERLPRQAARGLMWLTLARDSATPNETWIDGVYDRRVKQATDDERALALQPALSAGSKAGASSAAGLTRRSAAGCSISRSIQTGTWSDGFSQERTCLSMPAVTSRSAGLRRQQQVVDADAVVLLPGAGLIIPERVEAGLRR